MSMRTKVATSDGFEFAVAKLEQITASWAAMRKVHDSYVRMRMPLPNDVVPIEANKVRCTRKALDTCCLFPEKAKQFETQTRMPIADQHPSNNGSDETYTRDYPEEVRHRFDCHAHVDNRVADRIFDVFPNERRGLLHVTLSSNFGGALLLIKKATKRQISNMRWYDSPGGAGPIAAAYRELVFAVACNPDETSDKKSRAAKVLIYHRRRKLATGRFRRRGKFEHFCPGRHCCRDREHCVQQGHEMINEELGPRQWCTQRWTGLEDCADFVLLAALPRHLRDSLPGSLRHSW